MQPKEYVTCHHHAKEQDLKDQREHDHVGAGSLNRFEKNSKTREILRGDHEEVEHLDD